MTLPKLRLGISQSANRTGIEPDISMPVPVRSALSVNVTSRVWPCSVRLADAVYVLMTPVAGSGVSVIGRVSARVPVGQRRERDRAGERQGAGRVGGRVHN